MTKRSSDMSQEELLEEALKAERVANEMKALGDYAAARAFKFKAEGLLEEAVTRR